MPVMIPFVVRIQAVTGALLLALNATTAAPNSTHATQKVLAKMDEAGRKLSNLTADIKLTKLTKVINDESVENGKLFYQLSKQGSRARLEYEEPKDKTLLIDKGKALIYEARIKRLQEYDLGKNRDVSDFLLTGFGSTVTLTKRYEVSFVREETLNGTPTSLLDLKPRSDSSVFTRVELWIEHNRWIPIQTRLHETSGDHLTIQFDNLKINPGIPDRMFKLSVPSDVQRIKTATR
ncbi:MAG: outer membrane lipoprotein carrier protein LolA [Acidobacteriota bacterium]